ncbi:MAG TPA: hypothetical protein VMB05_18175 [Solirubrobacteraceae bacterium]|nr:hypothetical protein [Solirubrobacteraceae bacterium]
MAALTVGLAVIGIVVVSLAIAVLVKAEQQPPLPPAEDRAAPYREGLHAAIRLQRVAQDLEQQIYTEAEAVRRARAADAGGEP